MTNVYKIIKHFSSTKTMNVGSYRFPTKENISKVIAYNSRHNRIIGETESHALPVRLNDKKESIYILRYEYTRYNKDINKENKENKDNKKGIDKNASKVISQFTKKEFDELMKINSQ